MGVRRKKEERRVKEQEMASSTRQVVQCNTRTYTLTGLSSEKLKCRSFCHDTDFRVRKRERED